MVRQILTAEKPPEAEEKPKRRRPSKAVAEKKPARRTRASKPKAEAAATPVVAQEAKAKPTRRTRASKPTAKSETKKPKRTRTKTESG